MAELETKLTNIGTTIGNIVAKLQSDTTAVATDLDQNYYDKEAVNNLINVKVAFEVVTELPAEGDATKIYLLKDADATIENNIYNEYIWIASEAKYELLGSTKLDLSAYYTKGEIDGKVETINAAIAEKVAIADYNAKMTLLDAEDAKAAAHIANADIHVTAEQKAAWTGKQDALTEAQLAAVNSGITAEKVTAYDGLQAQINAKVAQADYDAKVAELEGAIAEKVAKADYEVDKATFALKADMQTELDKKVDKTAYEADKATFATKEDIADIATMTTVQAELDKKVDKTTYEADKATFAVKTEVEAALAEKVAKADYDVDKATFALKADVYAKTETYNQTEIDAAFENLNTQLLAVLNALG